MSKQISRDQLLADIRKTISETRSYQTISFPDFALKGERKAPQARAKFIKDLDLKGKKVFDIGCSNGYFTFLAARGGGIVTAYDKNEAVLDLLRKIACFYEYEVTAKEAFFDQAFFESLEQADVIIFLSVLHHIFNHAEADPIGKCRKVVHTLSEKTDMLVFEIGESGEPFLWSAKLNVMESDPAGWVKKNLFEGSRFTDITVHQAPLFDDSFKGRVSKWIVDMMRRASLRPDRPIRQAVLRIFYRLIIRDPRDARHIFIARR